MVWLIAAIYLGIVGALLRMAHKSYAFGPEEADHEPDQFGPVLAGRYVFMAFSLVCVVVSGVHWLVLAILAGFAGLGFFDAYVYGRAGHEASPHLFAGISALIVCLLVAIFGSNLPFTEV